jgi:hypothetical protein
MSLSYKKVANRYLLAKRITKTAGEVRFIKDRGGADSKEWGWGSPGPSERKIGDFAFDPKNLKPLAETLRATTAAMGYALRAYQVFTKLKSVKVSPDGALGGAGYIQKIADMRKQYMNVVEALSALSDTIHDELTAPHWNPAEEKQSPREREEVVNIINDAEKIKNAPEGWAIQEEKEMDEEHKEEGD